MIYILFPAPHKVYGPGKYILTSIMEIDGTQKYVEIAEKAQQCQNKETKENCLARNYLKQGLEQCSCVPYMLRNYSNTVFTIKLFIFKTSKYSPNMLCLTLHFFST